MAYLFRTTTDGLGHARNTAKLHAAQDCWEQPPELPDDETISLDVATDSVIEQIGRSLRTFDKQAAIDLLRSAASMIDQLCEQIERDEVAL